MSQKTFHLARPSGLVSRISQQATPNQQFQPIPAPAGAPPYHVSLDSILAQDQVKAITSASKLVLHTAGDTGNYGSSSEAQAAVANAMEADFASGDKPALFYHLGDVVYYVGAAAEYYPQFYEPYINYPAPIIGIPGNHDGMVLPGGPPSLTAFVNNFCGKTATITPDALQAPRPAMTLPNVYWILDTPFATFIGLYSNVPPSGEFDDQQLAWFANELGSASKDKALVVAVHHPVYSLDAFHAGSTVIEEALDSAYGKAGRRADLVLTAHVHNFQRFTEVVDGRQVPHLVLGAGGHFNLHRMQTNADGSALQVPFKLQDADDVTLENYCANRYGFMRLEVTDHLITGGYYAVDIPQGHVTGQAQQIDSFELDYRQHALNKSTRLP